MPSFQTKALVVTPISGDNFRIIPPSCMVSQACVLLCKRKPLFDALLKVYKTDVWSVRCIRYHSHCKEQNKWRRLVVLSWQDPYVWRKYAPKSGNEAERLLSHLNSVESSIPFTLEREKDRHAPNSFVQIKYNFDEPQAEGLQQVVEVCMTAPRVLPTF